MKKQIIFAIFALISINGLYAMDELDKKVLLACIKEYGIDAIRSRPVAEISYSLPHGCYDYKRFLSPECADIHTLFLKCNEYGNISLSPRTSYCMSLSNRWGSPDKYLFVIEYNWNDIDELEYK